MIRGERCLTSRWQRGLEREWLQRAAHHGLDRGDRNTLGLVEVFHWHRAESDWLREVVAARIDDVLALAPGIRVLELLIIDCPTIAFWRARADREVNELENVRHGFPYNILVGIEGHDRRVETLRDAVACEDDGRRRGVLERWLKCFVGVGEPVTLENEVERKELN